MQVEKYRLTGFVAPSQQKREEVELWSLCEAHL